MRNFKINDFKINDLSPPYIIAEIGVNHEGSIKDAKKLIKLAKQSGANAAKFQSYKADTLASKNSPAYWDLSKEKTKSQYKLFQKYHTFNPNDYETLARYCKEIEIDFMSTPFDDDAIKYLNPLVPAFKIASADINNLPFLTKIAKTKKPILLSTGASTLDEIKIAIKVLEKSGSKHIALMHCILNYPTKNENANLNMIKSLSEQFKNYTIGYSDHTLPDAEMSCLITSYILGARIIEKHFTLDKNLQGNDHYHSMDFVDLKKLKSNLKKIEKLLGSIYKKQPLNSEKISIKNARRSIVLKTKIKKNEIFSEKNLTYKRPGLGISPTEWKKVIGKKSNKNLEEDHILMWGDINF